MSSKPWYEHHKLLSIVSKRLYIQRLFALPNDHPLWIAIRTYSLSLSLSLGPALIPLLTSRKSKAVLLARIVKILRKELNVTGFAFAMTVAVGGGAFLDGLWRWVVDKEREPLSNEDLEGLLQRIKAYLCDMKVTPLQRAVIVNSVSSLLAILLMHSRRTSYTRKAEIPLTVSFSSPKGKKTSPTLDLTLMLFVRAMDSAAQDIFIRKANQQATPKGKQREGENDEEYLRNIRKRVAVMTDKLDAVGFWMASARYVINTVI